MLSRILIFFVFLFFNVLKAEMYDEAVLIAGSNYTFGEGIDLKHNYGTLSLAYYFPNEEDDHINTFVDARYHYFNKANFATNIGCGFRLTDQFGLVWGSNLYYDYRKDSSFHLHQIGPGLELFTPYVDLRINAYLPIGNTPHKKRFFEYPGGYVYNCKWAEITERGFDFEIERLLVVSYDCTFAIGIGGYYYESVKSQRKRFGEKARATLSYGTIISLEGRIFHDPIQKTFAQGVIEFSFPFDTSFAFLFNMMDQQPFYHQVQRNEILTKHGHCCWFNHYD